MTDNKDVSVRKKFKQVSEAGLGIAKNGKFQFPFKFIAHEVHAAKLDQEFNGYGQKHPQVGDFCAVAIPSSILSAGTVGKIVENHHSEDHRDDGQVFVYDSHIVQFLDGTKYNTQRYATGYLTEEQAKEVRDYYVKTEGRPERIRHDFWPEA